MKTNNNCLKIIGIQHEIIFIQKNLILNLKKDLEKTQNDLEKTQNDLEKSLSDINLKENELEGLMSEFLSTKKDIGILKDYYPPDEIEQILANNKTNDIFIKMHKENSKKEKH